ncbi:MAG: CBS domain-containing protein [Pirellulales bacterium]|nr:CBS domain-containing protein [Pirellulales bacterium]
MTQVCTKQKQVDMALENIGYGGSREELLVSRVMTAKPSCVSPDMSVFELIKLFHAKQFRHLLVTDADQRLIGVISDRDVLRCLGYGGEPNREALEKIKAGEVMSTDLVTVGPRTTLDRATSILLEQGISCLPVVEEGRLVGILTNTDLYVVLRQLLRVASRL